MNVSRVFLSFLPALRRKKSSLGFFLPVLVGGLLMLAQVAFFLLAGRSHTLAGRYRDAAQWDVHTFADIAESGYASTVPPAWGVHCNVSRLPGLPFLASVFSAVTRVDTEIACVMVSQLAAWVFWAYAFLLLTRWGFSRRGAVLTLVLMAAFPFSFFLISGMSESLFLACFLGLVYWSEGESPAARGLSALHGFGLGATRVTGPAMALATQFSKRPRRLNDGGVWAAVAAALALLLFLAYCAIHFGDWKIYFETQELKWGSRMNPFAPFYPSQYSFWTPKWLDYYSFGLFLRSWLAVALVLLFCLEISARPLRRDRLGCILAALANQYLSHGGQYYASVQPVARHYLPSFVLAFLVAAAYGKDRLRVDRWHRSARIGLLFGIVSLFMFGLALEFVYMALYARVSIVN